MALLGNISNNTVYADAEGNIAYWHGNFIPVRDTSYDWSRPVDGTTPATEWKGLHTVNESVHIYNPANGWLQNCNSTPFTVAGGNSPKQQDYPAYMAPDAENFRGVNAVRVLAREKAYTLDKVIAAGYDRTLSAFEDLVPALVNAFDTKLSANDSLMPLLQAPIAVLRGWNFQCADTSVATTLAIEWAQRLLPTVSQRYGADPYIVFDLVSAIRKFSADAPASDLLLPFAATIKDLQAKQGSWQVQWGSINRFQRISADIDQVYDDNQPSLPVPFASSLWGMLPSYNARYFAGTKKRYGVNGNSFICAVEFGKRIKAKSLLAGGESGDLSSPHFKDQLAMYARGQFKDLYFYKEDVLKHAEKTYHPGE